MKELLDVLYPPSCGGCDAPGDWLCARCRERLAVVPCPRPADLRALHALGRFEGPLRAAVHALKYRGAAVLAQVLGDELGLALARGLALGWRADVLVPVPLGDARRRERGFDQAELLARRAGRVCGVPVRPLLRRSRETRSQVGLGRAARARNVRAAFVARPARGCLVLVDDVATTGATLAACGRALRAAGAREVRGLVAAIER